MKKIFFTYIALVITACGGGGGGSSPSQENPGNGGNDGGEVTGEKTGQFKDSNTGGLTYSIGNKSSVTDENGNFKYNDGDEVSFSVGKVALGSTVGKPVVTPVDIASKDTAATNITRFLMMLDNDGNPDNGIMINESIQKTAENWEQVNFETTNLEAELSAILSDVNASGGTHTLPAEEEADNHMESTFLCAYSGGYIGTYQGADSGSFGVILNANSGRVEGVLYEYDTGAEYIQLPVSNPISIQQQPEFTIIGEDGHISGSFKDTRTVSGTWKPNDGSQVDEYSGSRLGGDNTVKYRFTGLYDEDLGNGVSETIGIFTFDISTDGKVTGYEYDPGPVNVANGSVVYGTYNTLSGTLNGTTLSVVVDDGDNTQISGTIDTSKGVASGSWENNGEMGTFSGSGCKLN